MKKGINYATYEFQSQVEKVINESNLPVSNIKLVLESILNQIISIETKTIEKEKLDYLDSIKQDTKDVSLFTEKTQP